MNLLTLYGTAIAVLTTTSCRHHDRSPCTNRRQTPNTKRIATITIEYASNPTTVLPSSLATHHHANHCILDFERYYYLFDCCTTVPFHRYAFVAFCATPTSPQSPSPTFPFHTSADYVDNRSATNNTFISRLLRETISCIALATTGTTYRDYYYYHYYCLLPSLITITIINHHHATPPTIARLQNTR
uniref:Secreted peptide n=1 Tax=Anopheles braziliensis TaxID=58242 RepID=A0A2M3ZLU2_9DIPT